MRWEEFICDRKRPGVIDRVKSSVNPIIMWGAGEVAETIYSRFLKNDVMLEDIFVDDNYYLPDTYFHGKNIISRSMFEKKYQTKKVDVIIGFMEYERGEEMRKLPYVGEIFQFVHIAEAPFKRMSFSYYEENIEKVKEVVELFQDDVSRKLFVAYFNARINDDSSYILDVKEGKGDYFVNDVYAIGKQESFLDCGAFTGDTIQRFLAASLGQYKSIIAVELDSQNYQVLEEYVRKERLKNVNCINCGLWDKNGMVNVMRFAEDPQMTKIAEDTDGLVMHTRTLDSIWKESGMPDISIMKINYEVAIVETLSGAINMIRACKPKIAVTVGLRDDSMLEIPLLIKKILHQYKIYLRYRGALSDTITLLALI